MLGKPMADPKIKLQTTMHQSSLNQHVALRWQANPAVNSTCREGPNPQTLGNICANYTPMCAQQQCCNGRVAVVCRQVQGRSSRSQLADTNKCSTGKQRRHGICTHHHCACALRSYHLSPPPPPASTHPADFSSGGLSPKPWQDTHMCVHQQCCNSSMAVVCRKVECCGTIHNWQLAVLAAGVAHGQVNGCSCCQQRLHTACISSSSSSGSSSNGSSSAWRWELARKG